MEANRQAYEDLTEQLGSYISMFSSQMSLSHVTQQQGHVSRSYSTLQHVPRHVSMDRERTCSLPRSRVHYLDTSVDTSDGDTRHEGLVTDRGFLSLPRHQARPRSRHQDRFRNRWGYFIIVNYWFLTTEGESVYLHYFTPLKFPLSNGKQWNTNVCFILLSELKADPSPAGPGVIVSCVLLKPVEVKKVKETNGFI